MSLEEYVRKFLESPDAHEGDKENIQALMTSRLTTGMELQKQGRLHEAIAEFTKENTRPINSDIDAEIVQKSYWHLGVVYSKLGDSEKAIAAFQEARALLKLHGVGASPHGELAEIFIEQGRLDEAIELCQEWLEKSRSGWAKQLLERAIALKEGKSE